MQASPPTVSTSAAQLERNLRRLREFAAAAPNWNGYGAAPFSAELVAAVGQVLREFDSLPQPFVSPLTDNGIQLDWVDGERELEVEIYADHFNWMDERELSHRVTGLESIFSVVRAWHER